MKKHYRPVKLPEFRGWTVDIRLKEFRRVTDDEIEFLSFRSYEGDLLLADYIDSLPREKAIEVCAMIFG